MVVARIPNRRVAGNVEDALEGVVSTESRKEWYEPLDEPRKELVQAADSCREVLSGSLKPFSALPAGEDGFEDRIVTVPVHFSGDDATVLNLPEVTIGEELQSEVLGVRGQVLATKDAVVNFDHLKGDQLTVEAPAECLPATEDAP